MAEVLRGRAPAKVNLILEVTARRDDGYHEIDTVLQELELADDVELRFGGESGIVATGPYAEGTPSDETNLAWRAAKGLAERTGNSLEGLLIALKKRIPPAGGLGGGASDAATVLRLLQQRWGASDGALLEVANSIGSDEAYFLVGGTARAQGRGERVTPMRGLGRHGVVLFIPQATIERKTARMFAALDALPMDPGGVAEAFSGREPGPFRSVDCYNSFERVAFDLFDGLHDLWADLERRTGDAIRLAGAGPTLFWIGPESMAARVAGAGDGLPCSVVQTAIPGPR